MNKSYEVNSFRAKSFENVNFKNVIFEGAILKMFFESNKYGLTDCVRETVVS